jgi:hypothetical protein
MTGATTWSYPKDRVTLEEAMQIVAALRSGFAAAYDAISPRREPSGDRPKSTIAGRAVPTREVFMRELERPASANTVDRLLHAFDEPTPTN